jgi:predicted permease
MVTACLTGLLLLTLALPVPPVFAVVVMTIGEVVALVWMLLLVLRLAHTRAAGPSERRQTGPDPSSSVTLSDGLVRVEP